MKNRVVSRVLTTLSALLLACAPMSALAENPTVEVSGTVINIGAIPLTATFSGTLDSVTVREGDTVQASETLATMKTTGVYASEDGTVRLFGNVGDSTAMVVERYGAVAYVEPEVRYTISASTRYAYESEDNRIIHPGEKVWIRSTVNQTRVGTGIVTLLSGTNYTVEILEGSFDSGESLNVYRDEAFTNSLRIGRGNVARKEYTTYEGSGIIVRYCVENNSTVKKGDLLFETMEGDFAGYNRDLTEIKAAESGVINTVSSETGSTVNAGDVLFTLYPDDSLRIEALVNEESLSGMTVGQRVTIHFTYVNGGELKAEGVVERVSAIGYDDETDETEEVYYKTIIKPDDISGIRYGMNVTVTN